MALLVASSPRRFLIRVVRGVPLMQRNGLPGAALGGGKGNLPGGKQKSDSMQYQLTVSVRKGPQGDVGFNVAEFLGRQSRHDNVVRRTVVVESLAADGPASLDVASIQVSLAPTPTEPQAQPQP